MRFLTLSLLMVLVCAQATADAAKPSIGEKQVFPLPNQPKLCPAPDGKKVAVINLDVCHFFTLDEQTQKWHGPDTLPVGSQGGTIDGQWPPYGWSRDEANNAEVFVLNSRRKNGVRFEAGKPIVVDLKEVPDISHSCEQRSKSPLDKSSLGRLDEDGHMVLQHPESKTVVEFPIQNHAPTYNEYGTFSPDGYWVLMVYNYGHLDNYSGGYLQLFDKDGKFALEIAEFSENVYDPAGEAYWLQNNWIVYFDGKDVVFAKFTEE